MRQFIDHFTAIQQWDAETWIAMSAVATWFALAIWGGLQLIPKAVDLYADLASARDQNREGE